MESHMEHVGSHRAESADHDDGEPVGPGQVASHLELKHHGDEETGETQQHGEHRGHGVDQEIRGGLAHRGGQSLDHPEEHGDLRYAKGSPPGQYGQGAGLR